MKQLIGLALRDALSGKYTPEEEIHLYRQAGLESFFCSPYDDATMDSIRNTAEKEGMVWTSVHATFSAVDRLWREDKSQAEASLQEQLRDLASTARVGVRKMIVHPFIGFAPHTPTVSGVEYYRRLLDAAAEKDILICLENVEGLEHLEMLFEVLKGHPAMRFCLDSGHELCYNGGQDLLAKFGHLLAYTHLDSNMGKCTPEGDPNSWHDDAHMLPYDGLVDMHHLASRLKALHYEGPLTMELKRQSKPGRHTNDGYVAMTDEAYLAEAVCRVRRLRDEINS